MAESLKRRVWRTFKYQIEGRQQRLVDDWMRYLLPRLSPTERKMWTQSHDDSVPLPAGAAEDLRSDHPRLQELRKAYAALKLPVSVHSQWESGSLNARLDLRYFCGDNPYVWHYREWPRANTLKFYIYAQYIRARDDQGLLTRLKEDGAFGCWTYKYPGMETCSRAQLDAVNELLFLNRHLGLLERQKLRVLDIGAGYGRIAYRMSQVVPGLTDYCCVDAIPESTFLCEYYLRYRGVMPPTRVVPLHEIEKALLPDHYDLALNVHSFSECTYDAIAWWANQLSALNVQHLLIVPNDPTEMLSTETNGSKRDFRPLIEGAGYELQVMEPVLNDPAVRELLGVHDHYFLFRRRR